MKWDLGWWAELVAASDRLSGCSYPHGWLLWYLSGCEGRLQRMLVFSRVLSTVLSCQHCRIEQHCNCFDVLLA
jgi:hypothetical protein